MSKGVFSTPRSLGQVAEIVVLFSQIKRLKNSGYEIASNMGEGEEQGDGVFLSRTEETFNLDVQGLSGPDKIIAGKFLKLLIRKYAKYKKYSGLTVS